MVSRIAFLFAFFTIYSAAGLAQTIAPPIAEPVLIPGISEPPEMRGSAKVLPTPPAGDKAFWEAFKQAGKDGFTEANLPVLDKFIEDYPSYADAYYFRANAEACGGKSPNLLKAKADLEGLLLRKDKDLSVVDIKDVLSLLAKIDAANGDRAAALDLLEKAMRIDLDSASTIFNIQGTSPETTSAFCTWNLTDLRLLANSAPKDWRPLALEGLYYQFFTIFKEEFYPQATAALQRAALASPRTPIVPYLQGELYTRSAVWKKKAWSSDAARDDFYRASLPLFTRAIQLDLNFEPAYAARAEVYLQLKEDALAIKDFDKVLTVQPDNMTAHSDRGIANMEMGEFYAAISDFDNAIRATKEEEPYLSNLFENRGDAYVKVGDFRRGVDDYSSAIKLQLQNQIVLMSLAEFRALYPEYTTVSDDLLLKKLNRYFEPQFQPDVFKKMLTQDNGKWGISLLNDLYEKRGDAYLNIGDYRRGILDFQRIFVGIPDFGKFTERWRSLGVFGHEEKTYLDVKASEPLAAPNPRIWVKSVGAKQSEVMAFMLDCLSHRLTVTSRVVYDANGNVVGGSSAGEGWSDVMPDTLGELLWNGVCQSKP